MATLPYVMAAGVSVAIALSNIQLCAARDFSLLAQSRGGFAQTPLVTTQQDLAPRRLNPNPNALKLPAKPEAVQIQRTEPITLQQALDLARRNNPDLQTAIFSLDRSRAVRTEAEATRYPNVNLGAGTVRNVSSGNSLSDRR